jgi:protein O-mannosyl-transferase
MSPQLMAVRPTKNAATKPKLAAAKPARWPAVALALLTIVAFLRVLQCGFVSLDDGDYVFNNPYVLHGLTPESIHWALTGTVMGLWHPLGLLSLMLDVQLFGLQPVAFHFMNVLYHTASVVLLFLILRRITGSTWRSALVAALFAVHPLRVESVVWISERKDVLAVLFGLLTLWAYVRYAAAGNWRWYGAALVFFGLSLMAKQSLVLLPVLLLLLDWWPLGRWEAEGENPPQVRTVTPREPGAISRGVVLLDKLPFLIFSAVAVVMMTRHGVSIVGEMVAGPANPFHVSAAPPTLLERLANTPIAYVRYLWKTIWFSGLTIFYPLPQAWPAWQVAGATAILLLITALAVWQRCRRPWLLVGWLWFIVAMLPVSGLVTISGYSMADRYSYFPCIGLLIMIAWSVPDVIGRRGRIVARIVAGAVLLVLLGFTCVQIGYWKDNLSLWGHAVAVTEPNAFSYKGFGKALVLHGDYEAGVEKLRAAVTMRPEDIRIRIELVHPLDRLGLWAEADKEIADMIAVIPPPLPPVDEDRIEYAGLTDAVPKTRREQMLLIARARQAKDRYSNGVALEQQATSSMTKHTAAIAEYREAVRLMPLYASAWFNLGNCLFADQDIDGAIAAFRQATLAAPMVAQYHLNLGVALGMAHHTEEGKKELQRAVELDPSLPARLQRGG